MTTHAPLDIRQRCPRCLLRYDLPGVRTTSEGICNICSIYAPAPPLGVDAFVKELGISDRRGRDYDCLVPVSGGFDSFYTAFYLVRRMGLRCLGIHYDNGISRDGKWAMLRWVEAELGMPIIVRRWGTRETLRNIRDGIRSLLPFGLQYVQAPFCRHCGYGIRASVFSTMVQHNLPSIWGKHSHDLIPFSYCLRVGILRYLASDHCIDSIKYLWGRYRQTKAISAPGMPPVRLLFRRYGYPSLTPAHAHLRILSFFDFIPWDKDRMMSELADEGVDTAFLLQSHADCRVHNVFDRVLQIAWGAGQDEIHICNRVRAGQLSIERGKDLIAEVRDREVDVDILSEIGLSAGEIAALFAGQPWQFKT